MNFKELVLEALTSEDITIVDIYPTYPAHPVKNRGAWTVIFQVKGDPKDYEFFYFAPDPYRSLFKEPYPFDYADDEYLDNRLLRGMIEKVKAYLISKHHNIDYDQAVTITKI